MDDILAEFASRAAKCEYVRVSGDDLTTWSVDRGKTVVDFLDELGFALAKAYHAGELSFATCDSIVNDLWTMLIHEHSDTLAGSWPDLFYQVYDAFDAGEYHRCADGSDDPVANFTNPAIAAIVAKL